MQVRKGGLPPLKIQNTQPHFFGSFLKCPGQPIFFIDSFSFSPSSGTTNHDAPAMAPENHSSKLWSWTTCSLWPISPTWHEPDCYRCNSSSARSSIRCITEMPRNRLATPDDCTWKVEVGPFARHEEALCLRIIILQITPLGVYRATWAGINRPSLPAIYWLELFQWRWVLMIMSVEIFWRLAVL